jgi:hypothetical protein
MAAPFHEVAHEALPNLTLENYRITSPVSWEYNCIAWAVGINNAWWWPAPGRFWPLDVPREETLEAFIAAFGSQGFAPCLTADAEVGLEKVALYAVGSTPTHAARQLSDGWWTSKLGPNFDIEHADLDPVTGGVYGNLVAFLSRARPS